MSQESLDAQLNDAATQKQSGPDSGIMALLHDRDFFSH